MCDKLQRQIIPIPLGEHKVEFHHVDDWLTLRVAGMTIVEVRLLESGNLQLCVWAEASQPAYVREVQKSCAP